MYYNQDEVEKIIYKSLVRIYVEGEKITIWLCQSVCYKF